MKTKIFSIYDIKTEAYHQPFFMQSSGAAIRAFTDLVQDKTTMIGKHPSDYVLFELGSFDDLKGSIENLIAPTSLGSGVEYIKNNINNSVEA